MQAMAAVVAGMVAMVVGMVVMMVGMAAMVVGMAAMMVGMVVMMAGMEEDIVAVTVDTGKPHLFAFLVFSCPRISLSDFSARFPPRVVFSPPYL